MSILTMDMSSYEVQKDDSTATEYDEEVLSSGWLPTLSLQLSLPLQWENKPAIPDDLVAVDADIFLQKVYSNQR
jgi:hypothetical protein